MTNKKSDSSSYLQVAESVTEGHPDKLCDQISDAVLDAILEQDPMGRVACEVAVTTGLVIVFGEITTDCYVDITDIVRRTIKKIGYDDPDYGFDYKTCGVTVAISEQSPDISAGVNTAYENRRTDSSQNVDQIGAGDQGIMIGYASNETKDLMPLPITLAHNLTKKLTALRKEGVLPYLRPDGKSQVVVEYDHNDKPIRIDSVAIAAQHDPDVNEEKMEKDIVQLLIEEVVPTDLIDERTKFYVNASGRFVVGGPMGDAGLTGRKIIVDTYGPGYKHGGGAFSGKDPTKVDRSGAYMARYIAKNIVAAGLAERCEVQLAYVIGMAQPVSVAFETYGTARIDIAVIKKLVFENFDLTPSSIIKNLDLRKPIYSNLAAYGHFGRSDLNPPWERIDKAEILRKESNLISQ